MFDKYQVSLSRRTLSYCILSKVVRLNITTQQIRYCKGKPFYKDAGWVQNLREKYFLNRTFVHPLASNKLGQTAV